MDHRKRVSEYIQKNSLKGVLFDFDGTLVDLVVDWDGMRKTLQTKFRLDSLIQINELLGSIRNIYGKDGLQKAYTIVEEFETEQLATTQLIHKRKELIAEIAKNTSRIGILSNNMTGTIIPILKKEGIDGYFEQIIGKDSVTAYKPDPEGVNKVLKVWKIPASSIVLIGNDEVDKALARNAQIHFYNITNE